MRKMSKTKFAEERGISAAMFCYALDGKRNFSHDIAVKIARVLKTKTEVWKRDGFLMARVAAWSAYVDKRNGGGKMKMRVWWMPQVPGKPFHVDVATVEEGVKVMDILARYDQFQFENKIKPDYCNTGGLQVFDTTDDTDSPEGSWVDWWEEESGEDDPEEFLRMKNG